MTSVAKIRGRCAIGITPIKTLTFRCECPHLTRATLIGDSGKGGGAFILRVPEPWLGLDIGCADLTAMTIELTCANRHDSETPESRA